MTPIFSRSWLMKTRQHFDDAAARHAADAEREVDADGACRDCLNRLNRAFLTEAHDRPFAELLLDLADGEVHRLQAFTVRAFVAFNRRHARSSLRGPEKPAPHV